MHKSFISFLIYIASHVAFAITLYSTSVDKRATVGYFFELHEIVVVFNKKTYPDVLLLSFTKPTQSTSLNALIVKSFTLS